MILRALAGADLEIRAASDGRTFDGIFVPWNVPTVIDRTLTEEFLPGAFDRQVADPGRISVAREHLAHGGTLIGRVTELRNDKRGLRGVGRISPTAAGDDTLELLRDGALDQLSIGFVEGQNLRAPGGVVQRKTAGLREIAVVMQGAYGDHAKVDALRAACPDCAAKDAATERQNAARAAQLRAALKPLPAAPRPRS